MPTTITREQNEIIAALSAPQAWVSPKFFYDRKGSALFECITRLPEYYLTRTERSIMAHHAPSIRRRVEARSTVIELGAGSCEKSRVLCELVRPRCFVPVDISAEFLHEAVAEMRRFFPDIDIHPLVADLCGEIEVPEHLEAGPRLVFFPGSSIGNFDPAEATALLARIHRLLGGAGSLLIGVDLAKDEKILEAAYADKAGVTAAFNRNVLAHINRLLGSDFQPRHWQHRAAYNPARSRVEMHLEASRDMLVRWPGGERHFRRGQRIHTESSYKYRIEQFAAMLAQAGFSRATHWTDPGRWFAVMLATP